MVNDIPLVMIVDDTPQNLQFLADLVQKNGYDYVMADSGSQVLDFVKVEQPDLILLDVMMPDLDGFEVCRQLKLSPETQDIPVIFITAKSDTNDVLAGFYAGGVDYITKPFSAVILEARMRTHVELKRSRDRLQDLFAELRYAYKRLEQETDRITILASHDYLTGLYNRRFMLDRIKEESYRAMRSNSPLALVLADIDDFKLFNDHYGHDCGDFILVEISRVLGQALRAQDVIARWGGEEFLLLLPETDLTDAVVFAEKLRQKIADTFFQYKDQPLFVTMTFGLNLCSFDEQDVCLKQADDALIKGKNAGKNCVMPAEDIMG